MTLCVQQQFEIFSNLINEIRKLFKLQVREILNLIDF